MSFLEKDERKSVWTTFIVVKMLDSTTFFQIEERTKNENTILLVRFSWKHFRSILLNYNPFRKSFIKVYIIRKLYFQVYEQSYISIKVLPFPTFFSSSSERERERCSFSHERYHVVIMNPDL